MHQNVRSLHCDLGINNLLAVENSRLLYAYTQIDARFPAVCYLIKHWAKQRKVNDPYRGTLSSYAYVLMVAHFLQTMQYVPKLTTHLRCKSLISPLSSL